MSDIARACGISSSAVSLGLRNHPSIPPATRAGKEVAQLYLQDVESSVERPPRELKGFQKVALAPGESTTVHFILTRRDCSFWDVTSKAWKCEAGVFIAHVGRSSRDLPLRIQFEVLGCQR